MDVVTSDLYLTAKWSVLNTDGPSWTVYLDANGGEFDDFDMGRHISKASVMDYRMHRSTLYKTLYRVRPHIGLFYQILYT